MRRTIAVFIVATMAYAVTAHAQSTYKRDIPAALAKQAKVDEATAASTAQKRIPKGTIKGVELEREHGRLMYSYDMTVAGQDGVEEVNVDAINGRVIGVQHESAAVERAEAAQEAAAQKNKKTTK
jgi:uncharacterized membrane protein YkoI